MRNFRGAVIARRRRRLTLDSFSVCFSGKLQNQARPCPRQRREGVSHNFVLQERRLQCRQYSRMSQTRKFDRHASRGVFVRVSLLEFGYKIGFVTQKSMTLYFIYQNSRRETRTNTPRAALIQKWLRGIITKLSHNCDILTVLLR